MNDTLRKLFPQSTKPELYVEDTSTMEMLDISVPSFGMHFNLIRAVEEYGPQRIGEIDKRLTAIEAEKMKLLEERHTLQKLVDVVKPT